MKLHLPKSLLSALVACVSLVSSIATTSTLYSSAFIGAVAFTLSQQEAQGLIWTWLGAGGNTNASTAANWSPSDGTTAYDWDGTGDSSIMHSGNDKNIIKFTGNTGHATMRVDFNTMSIGGIVVEASASGYYDIEPSNAAKDIVWSASYDSDAATIGGEVGKINYIIDGSIEMGEGTRWRTWQYNADANYDIEAGAVFSVRATRFNYTGAEHWGTIAEPATPYENVIKGGGTLKLDLTDYDLSRGINWTLQDGSTIDLTDMGAGSTATFNNLTLNNGNINVGVNGTTLHSNTIIGENGGLIQGTNVTLTGGITYATTPTIGGSMLTLNGSFTLGAALVIDLGITGDIADGTYALLKRVNGTAGLTELDLNVVKASLNIAGIIDPTRLGTLEWIDDELRLEIVSSTAASLTYTGGADAASISAFTWDTTNPDFDGGATFANDDLVTFTGYTEATLEAAIAAGVVTLADSAYLKIVGDTTNTFAANRVIVGENASFEINQSSLADDLILQGAATANVTLDGEAGSFALSSALDLGAFSGTLTLIDGTMIVAAASELGTISKLSLGDTSAPSTATLSLGGITVDKQINVLGTTVVTSTSGTTILNNITGDTGSLNLNGTIGLRGDVDYTGMINIVSGTTTFGSGETSDENMAASLINVNSGAQFNVHHGSGDYTGTDITLNGVTMSSNDLDAGTGVAFGKLTINGNSVISHTYNGIFSFTELTGSGNIDFRANAAGNELGQLRIEGVTNYSGTINVSQGDAADRLQFFEAVFDQQMHSHMEVSAASGSEIELVKTSFTSLDGSGSVYFTSVVEMWNENILDGATLGLTGFQFAEASAEASLKLVSGRLNLLGASIDSTVNRTITSGGVTIGTTLAATEWADDITLTAEAGDVTQIDTQIAGGGAETTITLSGVLSGTGALSVTGGGTLVLSGSNTMSGAIQVASVSTLQAGQANSLGTGTITNYGLVKALNGLTVGSAQDIFNDGSMDLGGTLTINKMITNRGSSASIELFADTVFDLAGAASDTTTHVGYTTYKLFDFSAGGSLDATAMGLTSGLLTYGTNVLLEGAMLTEGYTWVLRDDGTITYGPRGILTWDGPSGVGVIGTGGDGTWGDADVWNNSFGTDETFQNGDIVIFNKGAGTVNVAADVTTGTITITDADRTDVNAVAYTFTGSSITGVTTLNVSEAASATFDNSIDLSAAAVTVAFGSSLSLGTTTVIDSLSNTGSVSTTDSADLTINQAVGADGGTLDVAGDLVLGGADTTATNRFDILTVGGNVTNNSTITMGDGSAITGTLSGGILVVYGNTSVGGLLSDLSVFSNDTGTFEVNSDMTVTGAFVNAGTVDVEGDLTLERAVGTIIATGAVTLNSSLESTLTALTMAADQNLSLNAKLTVTGALTGAGKLIVTTLDAPTSGFGAKDALISADSLTGVTSMQLALSDTYLLGLNLNDAETMTLIELGTASGLNLTDLTFADGASDSYTAGTTQFTFGLDGNNITLTATIVGNRWLSDDTNTEWGSSDSWSGDVPTSANNAVFDGEGSHLVVVDQVGASASEIRVAVKAGSAREMDGYALSGKALTTGNLTLSSGLLEVGNTITIVDDNPDTVAQKGALLISGGTLTVANNGAINAVTATVSATDGLTIENGGSLSVEGALMATDGTGMIDSTDIIVTNDGSLKVGDGSQIDAFSGAGLLITQADANVAVTSLGEQSLDLSEGSTLSVATDTMLKGMTGTGSLELIDNGVAATTRKLTVDASAVITGGDASAAMIEVSTGANTLFNNLTVDSIHFANDLSSSDFYLGASSLTHGTGAGSIAVTMASANFFENAANGSYKFFQQNGGTVTWSSFALSQAILDDIAVTITQDQGNYTYKDVLQTRDASGNLTFIIQDTTGRTWDMDNDFAVTPTTDPNVDNSLSQIKPIYDPANAGKMASYDVLDHVNKVVIGDSKQLIDMTNLSGTGELIVSNLSGGSASAELSIIGNGTDSVLLRNTMMSVVSGNINAKDVTLNVQNVGAENQLYAGILNLDESTLDTGATGHMTVAGLTNEGETGAASTGAVVQGSVNINGAGGDYTGSYGTGASIYAQAGADQKLKADAALTVGGTGGTLTITDVTSASQLGGIASTGAHIIIDLTGATSETNAVTLGSASSVSNGGSLTLSVNGNFLEEGDTVVAFAGEALSVDSSSTLVINALNFDKSPVVTSGGLIELIEFADGSSIANESIILDASLAKYYTNVRYDSTLNMIVADFNTSFYSDSALTSNGAAGFELITDAFTNLGISSNPSSNSDLSKVMAEMDQLITTDPVSADKLAAAIAGASIATQGMALQDDIERQLRSIRNRTGSHMLSESSYEQRELINGWINAEGNQAELSGESTDAGYTMSNWGGTVGAGFTLEDNSTVGLALTAMYGDLTSTDVDQLDSDVSTYYISAFAHTMTNKWEHKFVLSAGLANFDGSRTVNYGDSAYSTDYSTSGYSVGVHYELSRHYYLNEDEGMFWQPIASLSYQMSQIDGYTETGSDAALKVDEQSLHRATVALGASLQMNIGESIYNRIGNVSMRALVKGDIGDTHSETEAGLAAGTRSASLQSAERGNFGVEFGAGLTIPVLEGKSSLFCDAAVELRENYSNVNATVGYRFSF